MNYKPKALGLQMCCGDTLHWTRVARIVSKPVHKNENNNNINLYCAGQGQFAREVHRLRV